MGKANRNKSWTPSSFLLQKNTGNDERQIMTSKEVVSLALFLCHQPKAEDDEPEPIAHPQNCKTECPCGYNKAFCFPCYAKIMKEHRAAKNKAKEV